MARVTVKANPQRLRDDARKANKSAPIEHEWDDYDNPVCPACNEYEYQCRCFGPSVQDFEEGRFVKCSCRYCFCMSRVEYGGECDNCLMGAHQG